MTIMITTENNYVAPQVLMLEVISENILCQSSLESVGENPGGWF